eukprot:scaffold171768_cov27-Tisochrysis_lutea.AAC.1
MQPNPYLLVDDARTPSHFPLPSPASWLLLLPSCTRALRRGSVNGASRWRAACPSPRRSSPLLPPAPPGYRFLVRSSSLGSFCRVALDLRCPVVGVLRSKVVPASWFTGRLAGFGCCCLALA